METVNESFLLEKHNAQAEFALFHESANGISLEGELVRMHRCFTAALSRVKH